MIYLTNAFSLNMLKSMDVSIDVQPITISRARSILAQPVMTDEGPVGYKSAIGHPDIANVAKEQLAVSGELHNRISLELEVGDVAIVAQYRGPRLPEGATQLPEDAAIEWLCVQIL